MIDLVVDASVAARAVTANSAEDRELRDRLTSSACHAPHLIDAEVGNALRKQVAAGAIEADTAAAALHALEPLIATRYPHTAFAQQAWALRHNISYYDALYAALAARLGLPLLTADKRLANAPGLPCAVEVIS
ncbi:MAG: type II toxin-antitoxin system VapC family toxin [Actinomycetes bacterium]